MKRTVELILKGRNETEEEDVVEPQSRSWNPKTTQANSGIKNGTARKYNYFVNAKKREEVEEKQKEQRFRMGRPGDMNSNKYQDGNLTYSTRGGIRKTKIRA